MANIKFHRGKSTASLPSTVTDGSVYIIQTDEGAGEIYADIKDSRVKVGTGTSTGGIDPSTLGALAKKDSVTSESFTPEGTINAQTFSGKGTITKLIADDSRETVAGTTNFYAPQGEVIAPKFTGSSSTFSGSYTPTGTVTVSTATSANQTATVSSTTGTATYTPAGTVSAPTINVSSAGATTTVKNPTAVSVVTALAAAAPGATAPANAVTYYAYDSATETLKLYQLGATKGNSITTSDVTVKTGDASYTATAPSFTGTGARLVTGNISVPATYTATFSGDNKSVSVSGTPNGTVAAPEFRGTPVVFQGDVEVSGSVTQAQFTGKARTITSK